MDSIKNNKAFLQMEPRKQEMVLLLIDSLNNKKLTEALPVLMQFREKNDAGRHFFYRRRKCHADRNFLQTGFLLHKKMQYEYLKPFIKAHS